MLIIRCVQLNPWRHFLLLVSAAPIPSIPPSTLVAGRKTRAGRGGRSKSERVDEADTEGWGTHN